MAAKPTAALLAGRTPNPGHGWRRPCLGRKFAAARPVVRQATPRLCFRPAPAHLRPLEQRAAAALPRIRTAVPQITYGVSTAESLLAVATSVVVRNQLGRDFLGGEPLPLAAVWIGSGRHAAAIAAVQPAAQRLTTVAGRRNAEGFTPRWGFAATGRQQRSSCVSMRSIIFEIDQCFLISGWARHLDLEGPG